MSELPAPSNLGNDPEATELLRVWVINEELDAPSTRGFDDPTTWGVILADLARNVARGLQETEGKDYQVTMEQIVNAFHNEITNPPEQTEPTEP